MRTKNEIEEPKVSHCCGREQEYYGYFGDGHHYYSDHCLSCQWDAVWVTPEEFEERTKNKQTNNLK